MSAAHPQFLRNNMKTWKVLAAVFGAGWCLKLGLYAMTKDKMDEQNQVQESKIQQALAKQKLTTDPVQQLDMQAINQAVDHQERLWALRDRGAAAPDALR